MAEKTLIRRIIAIFDRDSAKKTETELAASLETAGKKGGENFLRELKKQFDTRTADLKVSLAKGIIDEKEFRKQSDLAAREFNAGLVKGIEGARQAGTLAEREYLKLSRQMKRVQTDGETVFTKLRAAAVRFAATMAAAFTLRAIVNFGREAVKAAADSQVAWKNLAGSVQAAGVEFSRVEPDLRAAADQFERLTTHDDDEFAATLQRLIALTGDYSASLQNVTLVADVAARFFEGDLTRAADVVGRAMLGDVEMLKRLGIEAGSAQEALDMLAQRSMGAAAERAGTLGGQLSQLNVAWGNFKKAVGNAMIEAGGGTSILETLTGAVRILTQVVGEHPEGLRFMGETMIWVARVGGAMLLGLFSGLATGLRAIMEGYAMVAEAESRMPWHDAAGKAKHKGEAERLHAIADEAKAAAESLDLLARVMAGTKTLPPPKRGATGTAPGLPPAVVSDRGSEEAADKATAKAAERADAAIAAINRQIDVEQRRAEAIRQGTEAVEALNRELFIEQKMLEAGVDVGTAAGLEIQHRAGVLYDAQKAIEMVGKESLNASTAMDALTDAFKKGGVAGAIALAKQAFLKIKEHVASAISEGAKALGAFASGNFGAAATHSASAVQHGLAANEWRKLAQGGGGGGGGGRGAAGSGGLASGSATGLQQAGSVEPPGTEVHIYMDPLAPQDPRVQSFVHETNRQIAERFGDNANVTWHPRSGS